MFASCGYSILALRITGFKEPSWARRLPLAPKSSRSASAPGICAARGWNPLAHPHFLLWWQYMETGGRDWQAAWFF